MSKEFAIRMEDRPGALGKVCRALADRGLNILAFQSCPAEGESLFRIVVDNPKTAKTVLDDEGLDYTEAEVTQVKLPHRAGELARAASRLGEANINIPSRLLRASERQRSSGPGLHTKHGTGSPSSGNSGTPQDFF